jgi:hypothetical protein
MTSVAIDVCGENFYVDGCGETVVEYYVTPISDSIDRLSGWRRQEQTCKHCFTSGFNCILLAIEATVIG